MQKFRQKFTLAALALALTLSLGLLARPALAVDAWLQPSVEADELGRFERLRRRRFAH